MKINRLTSVIIIFLLSFINVDAQESKIYQEEVNGKINYYLENDLNLKKIGEKIFFGKIIDGNHKIYSIDKENNIIDSISLPSRYSGYRVKLLNNNELNFSENIIAYEEFRESCPGGGSTTYITKNKKGKFTKLISSFYGTMGNSIIYLPKLEKKGITLVANGELNDTSKTNIYKFPEDLNIPIDELIIETDTEYLEDVEGLTEEEIIIKSLSTTFYQWNGKKLIPIKTLEHIKPLTKKNITNYPKKGKAYVIAKNGLTYRKSPNIKSAKYGTFDFGTEVIIIKNTGINFELNDEGKKLKGQWVKVKAKNDRKDKSILFDGKYKYFGYVFNGFLVDSINVDFKEKK